MMPTPEHVTEHMAKPTGANADRARMNEDALAAAMKREGRLSCSGAGLLGKKSPGVNHHTAFAAETRQALLLCMKDVGDWIATPDCAKLIGVTLDSAGNHLSSLLTQGVVEKEFRKGRNYWRVTEAA